MALTPNHHALIVEPSLVDNNESQTSSGLFIPQQSNPQAQLLRGVVRERGEHMDYPPIGDPVHYSAYYAIGSLHVVLEQHVIAWGDESE